MEKQVLDHFRDKKIPVTPSKYLTYPEIIGKDTSELTVGELKNYIKNGLKSKRKEYLDDMKIKFDIIDVLPLYVPEITNNLNNFRKIYHIKDKSYLEKKETENRSVIFKKYVGPDENIDSQLYLCLLLGWKKYGLKLDLSPDDLYFKEYKENKNLSYIIDEKKYIINTNKVLFIENFNISGYYNNIYFPLKTEVPKDLELRNLENRSMIKRNIDHYPSIDLFDIKSDVKCLLSDISVSNFKLINDYKINILRTINNPKYNNLRDDYITILKQGKKQKMTLKNISYFNDLEKIDYETNDINVIFQDCTKYINLIKYFTCDDYFITCYCYKVSGRENYEKFKQFKIIIDNYMRKIIYLANLCIRKKKSEKELSIFSDIFSILYEDIKMDSFRIVYDYLAQ